MYSKGNTKLVFDIKIGSPQGMLLAARLNRTATEVGGAAGMTRVQPIKTLSINKAHQVLGHVSEEATHLTAKALGWHITIGKTIVCECCAIGKAKQKRVKIDKPKEKSNEVNGRIYLDLSRKVSPMSENQPRRTNWCMIVDEKTGYKTSYGRTCMQINLEVDEY